MNLLSINILILLTLLYIIMSSSGNNYSEINKE